MAVDLPFALIREIQLALRRDAGLPSFDPADPSLPSLPTIRDAIASLDPTLPPDLRCRRCQGGLIRGSESTICIFCGADRRKEAPDKAISFNSTAGCRRFLESLDLDGTEAVNLDTESSDSNKGRDAPKEELALSSLLDLELRWPLEKEGFDSIHANKEPIENSYALNMSGVDLDTYFSDTKKNGTTIHDSLYNEQLMPKEQIIKTDDHWSAASHNSGSFQNLQSSNFTVSSTKIETAEFSSSFAVWEADFQPGSSETFPAEPNSVDLFQGSSANFVVNSGTRAATFSQHTVDHEASIKSEEGQPHSGNNCIQDDLWCQTNTEGICSIDQFKGIGETNNAELKNGLNSMAVASDSSVQGDVLFATSTKELNNIKDGDDNDDTLDAWQDFTSSGEASWGQNVTDSTSTKELNDATNLDDNDDSLDTWQDFTSSGEAQSGLSNSWAQSNTETPYVHASGMQSMDLQDMDFGGFIHSDSLAGSLGGQQGSLEANNTQLVPSVSDSVTDSTIWGTMNIDENSAATPDLESSNSIVEKLLSQMHDLSFMLDTKLSIPKVEDNNGLKP